MIGTHKQAMSWVSLFLIPYYFYIDTVMFHFFLNMQGTQTTVMTTDASVGTSIVPLIPHQPWSSTPLKGTLKRPCLQLEEEDEDSPGEGSILSHFTKMSTLSIQETMEIFFFSISVTHMNGQVKITSGPEKIAKWNSVLNHLRDIHTHDDPLYPKCQPEIWVSRDKDKWLKAGEYSSYTIHFLVACKN